MKKIGIGILGIMISLAAIWGILRLSGYRLVFQLSERRIEFHRVDELLPGEEIPDWIDVQIVPINGVGRRGEALEGVNDIVIHYVGNPGTTAQQNRNYYANPSTQVSSHFLIGLDGEIILCVPLSEKSSATNWRNTDTISIETCHPDESGQYTDATYASMVKLTAWLCSRYGLDSTHVIRHGDVTGKNCPKYFMENEAAWETFKADVQSAIDSGGNE